MEILSVTIDLISFLLGGAVFSFITVLYFVFSIKDDWQYERELEIKDKSNTDGMDLINRGREIEKEISDKSRDELIDNVTK